MLKLFSLRKINIALAIFLNALVSQLPIRQTDAAGPLANCGVNTPYKWANGGANIPFNPDQGTLGPLSNAQAVAAVQNAFDVWAAVPSSTVTYSAGAQLSVDVTSANFVPYFDAAAPDGLSAIVFDTNGSIFTILFGANSGVLGFAGPEWGTPATCTIDEGYSFLNGAEFGDATAALDVMVHEFGHYTNLAHTVVNGQIYIGDDSGPTPNDTFTPIPNPLTNDVVETMYPFYFGPGIGTNTLEKDDIASVSRLYPEPNFATSTGSISGTIYAPNSMTKLTGVTVIARNIADPFNDAVSAISSDFTEGSDQADPVVGTYKITGLTPGASYAVYVDEILDGGFSTVPLSPLPGPEEFYNGANESSDGAIDDPTQYTPVAVAAGVETPNINIIFNRPTPGVPLAVGDDGSVQIFLPFTFAICGQPFDSVFVNANGNVTFGVPNADFSESAAEMRSGPPRIAGLWDDLNASAGGTVYYTESGNAVTIYYEGVPEWSNTGSNTFSITLRRSSNHIDVAYGAVSAADGLGGVSCGGAITSGFEPAVDLSSYGTDRINLHNQPAVYEVWTAASPFDLDNSTVSFTGTTNYNDNWSEPNNTPSKARRISVPFNSIPIQNYTEIEPTGGDIDWYRVRLTAGTSLLAEIKTGQMDSLMALFDSSGNLVAVDDDSGAALLSRFVAPIAASGDYYLVVTTFPDVELTGAGETGGRYVLDLQTVTGTLLNLGDDNSIEVPLQFSFPFNGRTYNSVFVNANGNLTFGSGDTDFSETVAELLSDQPRIAPLWDDLSPNVGGLVLVDSKSTGLTVTFREVPEFAASTTNTFSVTLLPNGRVDVVYGGISAIDGLAGVSPGGGAANPGQTDLSAALNLSAVGTTYELFSASRPNDLSGKTLSYLP